MHVPGLRTNEPGQVRFLAPNFATTTDWRNVGRMKIDILPDDVLPDIFDFFVVESNGFEAEH
jgi:hypothetical protein